jgi:hypothetical protein
MKTEAREGDLSELSRAVRDTLEMVSPNRLKEVKRRAALSGKEYGKALDSECESELSFACRKIDDRLEELEETRYVHEYERLQARLTKAAEKLTLSSL